MLQNVSAQDAILSKDDFEKMSFDAEINKTEYYLLEPLTIRFKFSNPADQWLKTSLPYFISQTRLKISHNGKSFETANVFGVYANIKKFPRLFRPSESVEEIDVLQPSSGIFGEPGNYQIQFILMGSGGVKKYSTSVFDIIVKEPTGIDKEAFDFLEKHRSEGANDVFYFDEKDNESRLGSLTNFVNAYGTSVYGEYAIFSLGKAFEFNGKLEKAKVEFEKIGNSENSLLAVTAKKSLFEIEEKIKENQKNNLQKTQKEKQQ